MIRKLTLAAAIAASVLAGGVAFAAPPSPSPSYGNAAPAPQGRPHGMARADANGDGVVTKQEAIAQATRRFDKMDANHDGKLTATELASKGHGRAARGGSRGGRGYSQAMSDDQQ